jgi:hypothetical protein
MHQSKETLVAYAWQSVEEAAVTLGISTRTLHRRISKGDVETRLEDGRREVLVCLPDPEPEVAEEPAEVSDSFTMPASFNAPTSSDNSTAIILAEKEVALANEKVRRTELALAAFQHTSTLLQEEASRTRVSARCAWAAVAVLSVGVYVAVGWTASQVTSFRANNANLTRELNQATATAQQKAAEVEKYRDERDQARQASARMEGELSVTKATLAASVKKPSTQPSLLEKLARIAAD